jgi:adenylate cyclase class 2
MDIEHEVKLLDVDVQRARQFFAEANIKKQKTLAFRRYVFDTIPTNKNAWIRLRTDGTKTTLTYKHSHKDQIDGMQEVEVAVDSFDQTKKLLEAAGLRARNYQENSRDVYTYMQCEVTIDHWPLIPSYIEIEAANAELVSTCAKKLAFLSKTTTSESTERVYERYGIDLSAIDHLAFDAAK